MKLTFCTWIKKHRNATLLHWFVFLRHLQTIWFGKYWGERIITGHRSPSYWHHGRYTRRCERWRSVECNSHHYCGNAKDVHGSEMRYVHEILCIFMRNISKAEVEFQWNYEYQISDYPVSSFHVFLFEFLYAIRTLLVSYIKFGFVEQRWSSWLWRPLHTREVAGSIPAHCMNF